MPRRKNESYRQYQLRLRKLRVKNKARIKLLIPKGIDKWYWM